MKLVFLPGLDGTGLLFNRLIDALPKDLSIEIFSLDEIAGDTYYEQANELAKRFENENIIIVAESYSGRIAYELCGILGNKIKGIVFLASFISSPSLISKLAGYLPLLFIKPLVITKFIVNLIGFNGSGRKAEIDSIFHSLQKCNKTKIKSRLRNISKLTKPDVVYKQPVTYIKPHNDYLVSGGAVRVLQDIFVNLNVVTVQGGHFIAQSNPEECSKIVCSSITT